MRLLDYAWTTFSSVAAADHEKFRLILSEKAARPTVGREGDGYVVKLPIPRMEKEGIISVQGLFADADDQGWAMLWRLFRASLYHAAFHVSHGNLRAYRGWAKEKDQVPAIYTISLLEDYRITLAARERWPGTLSDIAYANLVGATRMTNLDDVESRGLRLASKHLLSLWGVPQQPGGRVDEDQSVLATTEKVRGLVETSLADPDSPLLAKAADLVYANFDKIVIPQIPAFPHTEAHSGDSIFGDHVEAGRGKEASRLANAFRALGLEPPAGEEGPDGEFKDTMQAILDANAQKGRIVEYYQKLMANTHLEGVTFPDGDYSAFMRTRAELAGPIRNIKNHLLTIKNVVDENPGKDSGQVDMPMAMQVVASGVQRTDVFVRDEPILKDEAWAILVDASRSVTNTSLQIRGIATCLAEVAASLMRERSRWGLFGFNESFQIVKDFEEHYITETKARIGGLAQTGATYLPDALEVAAKSLNLRPIENKYLVVVSDCRPTGYEGVEEELLKRVNEVNKSGIMMVGIGVESPDVKKYFKVNSVLSSPYEMMKFFVRSYIELSGTSA